MRFRALCGGYSLPRTGHPGPSEPGPSRHIPWRDRPNARYTPHPIRPGRTPHMSEPAGSATAHLPRSIATVSLGGTLPEKLDAAATIGFDAVEIFENDLLTFDGSPADVRRIAEDLGIAIVLYQPFRDFEAMPDPK